MQHSSIKKFKQVKVSSVSEMTPYEQVKLVFSNITGKLSAAKLLIERRDFENKGLLISDCITLLGALQQILDFEQGKEISTNLDSLYDYCQKLLLDANLHNDIQKIDEVLSIMTEIKSGWESIPPEQRS
ncbi:flagellar export chaperone FliS [Pseudoalteromonas phenolica]|jgi:flagellar protein FliS|uniref:Flagellar secretion chaperone FliS n=1 Tax=Pseudoalteromonas phenolica TaxID=161398 RepID=A0A5R9Q0M2_9GAMM|nr:flagellar export chaperone FliS [Pseudoalteromonas phenolica]TLX45937.1 flagellar export chaperone FliS [Pseudoalteromonas phenolica]